MKEIYNMVGQVVGYRMDGITKPQRRRKERALFRLLFDIEKEEELFKLIHKTFSTNDVKSISAPYIDRMKEEAYNLRRKLSIATDEQLEEFKQRMIDTLELDK
jgi:hypothetical protein